MRRLAPKKDTTQSSLSETANKLGWVVIDHASAGDGLPDISLHQGDVCIWVECKSTARSKLTPAQVLWFERYSHRMICLVVYHPKDIIDIPRPRSEAWERWRHWYFNQGGHEAWRRFSKS